MSHPLLVPTSLILLAGAAAPGVAQLQRPTVIRGAPAADWIAHPEAPNHEFGVFHFRRALDLEL
jgi:hypothetical protein